MCHISIELDQAIHPVAPVLDVVEASSFFLRSIRVVPSSGSRRADVHLSLGGGSKRAFDALRARVERLPGVIVMRSTAF